MNVSLLRRLRPLVGQGDFESGIEKCQLAQPGRQPLKLKFRRDREDLRVGQERDQRAGVFLFLTSPMTSSFCVVLPRSNAMW